MTSIPDWMSRDVKALAKRTIEEHESCDIGNPSRCDLYHDLIQDVEQIIADCMKFMRQPMRCGHPEACRSGDECTACQRENAVRTCEPKSQEV